MMHVIYYKRCNPTICELGHFDCNRIIVRVCVCVWFFFLLLCFDYSNPKCCCVYFEPMTIALCLTGLFVFIRCSYIEDHRNKCNQQQIFGIQDEHTAQCRWKCNSRANAEIHLKASYRFIHALDQIQRRTQRVCPSHMESTVVVVGTQ